MQNIHKNSLPKSRFTKVEALRKQLLTNQQILRFVDFGNNKKMVEKTVSDIARNSAKNPKLCSTLAEIVAFVNPQTAIELGTSLGISLAFQQLAAPNCRFVSHEGGAEVAEFAKSNLKELGLNPCIKIGSFEKSLPETLQKLQTIDFAFIDGHHQQQPTLDYFNQIYQHLSPNGVVVFDDIYWSEGMKLAWEKICQDSRVSISIDLFHLGIVFIRKGVEKQHFLLRI
ncbi:MAG: class I SAM-dependent methyltransferase [Flavobacteriales bacterium]|nr:class I SAM-dependent methyltransferase [Flavobacteriales bacterium]